MQANKQTNEHKNHRTPRTWKDYLIYKEQSFVAFTELFKYNYYVNVPVSHHQTMYYQNENLN